jgi:hypothetical protein
MPAKTHSTGTVSYSITLPVQAVEMIMELIPTGLFGDSRGEVSRALILSRLEQLAAQNLVKVRSPQGAVRP